MDKISNNASNFFAFQMCCLCIAAVASISFIITGFIAPNEAAQVVEKRLKEGGKAVESSESKKI